MKLIINNHKSGIPIKDIDVYQEEISRFIFKDIRLVVCPSDNQITLFKENNYYLGSQDVNSNLQVTKLKELSVKYTIVGHSDKREINKETNQDINEKIKILLANDITPILCIGEKENEKHLTKEILKQELEEGLKDIETSNIIIAYEPIWAISSGHIPSNDELNDKINYIKDISTKLLNNVPTIIYGGSVSENTIEELEKLNNIDGYLIGSASLDINKLKALIEVIK